MPAFDAKLFNAEVFQKYYDSIPNLKLNKLLNSGALRPRPDLVNAMSDQTGGNYITTPLFGLLDGSPVNYDGSTDITTSAQSTYSISRIVVGRAKGWTEKDFSYDITGGVDFMANAARQIKDYWDGINQTLLINILTGVFSMTDTDGAKFVASHTSDISEVANSESKVGYADATSFNSAMQKALGDNKAKFALIIMHSVVATNLENLKLLTYLKYTDANGMERDTNLATLNGRLVLVDDSMPTVTETKGSGQTATTTTKYVSYILGLGSIEYTDCGAKVPFEMYRNPAKNGGETTLYSRERLSFCPYGISFTKASMTSASPTDDELKSGTNWKLVQSSDATPKTIDLKAIPIARVLSLG